MTGKQNRGGPDKEIARPKAVLPPQTRHREGMASVADH